MPKGKLNQQWNLIVQACKRCNGIKSDLEDDISAITMQPDIEGSHIIEDPDLSVEAIRKGKAISRHTKKPVSQSQETISANSIFGNTKASFTLKCPPRIEEDRIYELAKMHMLAFLYFLTYDDKTKVGRHLDGVFASINVANRSDWGNDRQIAFARMVGSWRPKFICTRRMTISKSHCANVWSIDCVHLQLNGTATCELSHSSAGKMNVFELQRRFRNWKRKRCRQVKA